MIPGPSAADRGQRAAATFKEMSDRQSMGAIAFALLPFELLHVVPRIIVVQTTNSSNAPSAHSNYFFCSFELLLYVQMTQKV